MTLTKVEKVAWWEENSKVQIENAMDIIFFYYVNKRFPHVSSKIEIEKKMARILLLYRKAEKLNTNKYMTARNLLNKYLS